MDFMSSPLPSSGLPDPTPSSPQSDRRAAYNARRRAADPLNFDDEAVVGGGAPEAQDEDDAAAARRRRPKAARNQQALTGDVPPVKDQTGEVVLEHFEAFLTKYVSCCYLALFNWVLLRDQDARWSKGVI